MDVKHSDGGTDLPGQIKNDLDWDTVKKVLKDIHKLNLANEVVYRKGNVVVHDNEIAYQLDFEATVTLSILFDKNGKCLSLSIPDNEFDGRDGNAEQVEHGTQAKAMFQKEASRLADIISTINKD